MERPGRWTRLRLNGPRRLSFRKLEKKAPIACAPTEERLTATTRRMPEIVLPFRDARQEVRPFAGHCKAGVVRGFWQVTQSIPCRPIRLKAPCQPIHRRVRRLRKPEGPPLPAANDKYPLPQLRHPIIGSIDGIDRDGVARAHLLIDCGDTAANKLEAFALSRIGEAKDILEQEEPRQRVS